jgi:Zn-dependent protease with chaperone function
MASILVPISQALIGSYDGLSQIYSGGLYPSVTDDKGADRSSVSLHIRKDLEKRVSKIAQRLGVEGPITVGYCPQKNIEAYARGSSLSGRKVIRFSIPALFRYYHHMNATNDAYLDYLIGHELAHIGCNHNLYGGAFKAIVGAAIGLGLSALFMLSLVGYFFIPVAGLIGGYIANEIFHRFTLRHLEMQADEMGFLCLSPHKRKAMLHHQENEVRSLKFLEEVSQGKHPEISPDEQQRFEKLFQEYWSSSGRMTHPSAEEKLDIFKRCRKQPALTPIYA